MARGLEEVRKQFLGIIEESKERELVVLAYQSLTIDIFSFLRIVVRWGIGREGTEETVRMPQGKFVWSRVCLYGEFHGIIRSVPEEKGKR